jgi:hypothetical protein
VANNRGHGGYRPGSGRKPKPTTKVVADYHQAARDKIGPRLCDIIDQLFVLAMGVTDGEGRYLVPPDRQANIYLLDRILGRPTERSELTGSDGGKLAIEFEHALASVYGPDDAQAEAN